MPPRVCFGRKIKRTVGGGEGRCEGLRIIVRVCCEWEARAGSLSGIRVLGVGTPLSQKKTTDGQGPCEDC